MNKKQLLILGGTNFLGRVVVEQLLQSNDYEITLFNRGKRNPDLFPTANRIHGDRETDDILKLGEHNWDCVIDFSGYYPQSFKKLLEVLKGKVKRFVFISTLSVYDIGSFDGKVISETDKTLACSPTQRTSKLPDDYGEKKAEMERILLQQDWLDAVIIRPSFVYGKYDFTDRFYHWLWRGKTQQEVLLPSKIEYNVSLTEVNQLADGIIRAVEVKQHNRVYNAVTFPDASLKAIAESAKPIDGLVTYFIADDELLAKQEVKQDHFPLFMPLSFTVDNAKWIADFNLTIPSTLFNEHTKKYYDDLGWPEPKAGLNYKKEAEVIELIKNT
ncbi:MAG: NAD-dependent epimerase/dehydratase family protein [Chitinophagales bacterium]|nr:NAD-dependent epimerase/dehydratase family protein [Chitinophagales bacterium]